MGENQTDRSLSKENFILSFLIELPNIIEQREGRNRLYAFSMDRRGSLVYPRKDKPAEGGFRLQSGVAKGWISEPIPQLGVLKTPCREKQVFKNKLLSKLNTTCFASRHKLQQAVSSYHPIPHVELCSH